MDKRMLGFKNDRSTRSWIRLVSILLLVPALVAIVGSTYLPDHSTLAELVHTIGEALLVAYALAVVVDPYIKTKAIADVVHEVNDENFFASRNPRLPKALRTAFSDRLHMQLVHDVCRITTSSTR